MGNLGEDRRRRLYGMGIEKEIKKKGQTWAAKKKNEERKYMRNESHYGINLLPTKAGCKAGASRACSARA